MKKINFKKTIFIVAFSLISAFLGSFFTTKQVRADVQCGDGYVCWESNGGSAAVFSGCFWNGSYCQGSGPTTRYCSCEGSPDCSCTIAGGADCETSGADADITTQCTCFGGPNDGDWCGNDGSNANLGCLDDFGEPYDTSGKCKCSTVTANTCVLSGEQTIGCCFGETASPTPVPPTSTPGGGGGPTSTPGPTANPYFSGNLYDDVNAVVSGLGGTDNLCTGDTSTLANGSGGVATISRTGESTSISAGFSYTLTAGTSNSDYTVTLDLPFPPPDPAAAWQCACNADPGDPYRCIYTNQSPPSGSSFVDFFIYRANLNNTAWWQTLGGHIYSETNIETRIPSVTCLAPDCIPALIGSDTAGVQDSAGFPTTNTGDTITTVTGDTYIHEVDGRTTSVQGQAQGVSLPVEDYAYFSSKMIGQAQTLSNAIKPSPSSNPGIYLYTGDLTITEASPWNVSNTEQIIVFVSGNLTFDDTTNSEARLATVATGGIGYLQFIIGGDLIINPSVGYADYTADAALANTALVEGIYIADGLFTIQGEAATTDRKFVGAGTFVGWSGVQLERNFDDGATPTYNNEDATETFIYRPDLLVNAPQIVKSAHITWQEVAPQWPGL